MNNHIKTLGMKKLWAGLTHPHAFAYVFLFGCMLIYGVVYVDIPTRSKTALNIGLDTYLENWRLHANATKVFIAYDEKGELKDECKELERMIYRFEQSRLNIVGHPNLPNDIKSNEISRILSMKGDLEKKLQAARLDLRAATQSYDELVANR